MLWYKNWFETRWGVVSGLGMWILLGAFFYWLEIPIRRPPQLPAYGFFMGLSTVMFMMLAGSGVRAHPGSYTEMFPSYQAIPFTLSLPVRRRRILAVRAMIGILEAAGLSLILLDGFVLAYLGTKATLFDLTAPLFVTIIFGVCSYCLATLLANLFNLGLYSILTFGIWIPFLLWAGSDRTPPFLRLLTMGNTPIGTMFAIPWLPILVYLGISAVLFFAAIKIVESRDY